MVHSESPAGLYFMNTHPSELRDHDRLLASLSHLKQNFSQSKLILEVHEQSVTDLKQMKLLHESLKDLGIGLATSIKGRDPLIDGFGLIAFASLTPMIFVMAYGLLIQGPA